MPPPRVALVASWLLTPATAHGQDSRDVKEPRVPALCATLSARLAATRGLLSDAAEAMTDTTRIQDAIDHCAAGRHDARRAGRAPFSCAPTAKTTSF